MSGNPLSRRILMRHCVQALALGVLVPLAARAETDQVCADPGSEDQGLRKSLSYVEQSADATKACGGCGFFTGTANGCGECQILQGTVHSRGHCDSWSPRA